MIIAQGDNLLDAYLPDDERVAAVFNLGLLQFAHATNLVAAWRTDQAGNSTFPEFLAALWRAGVVRYDVDLVARTVAYYGCNGEEYIESYPAIEVE